MGIENFKEEDALFSEAVSFVEFLSGQFPMYMIVTTRRASNVVISSTLVAKLVLCKSQPLGAAWPSSFSNQWITTAKLCTFYVFLLLHVQEIPCSCTFEKKFCL
jgi:hypothetical protein